MRVPNHRLTFSVEELTVSMRSDRQSKVERVRVARVEGEVSRTTIELRRRGHVSVGATT